VIVPQDDPVLPVEAHPRLEQLGYRLHRVAGVTHVIHRDDLDAFLAVLKDELREGLAA
jgi:pimeloyl-ACP methyl ester carboxylesterase